MGNPSKQFEFIRLYPRLIADPATGKVGEIYYNSSLNKLRICVDPSPIWSDIGYSAQNAFQDRNNVLINGGNWSHELVPGVETILAENTSLPSVGGGAPPVGFYIAKSFTVVSPTTITKISLSIRAFNPAIGTQTVTILRDDGFGTPDINQVVATSQPIDLSLLGPTFSLVDFDFTGAAVSPGVYWFYTEAKDNIAYEFRNFTDTQLSSDNGINWTLWNSDITYEVTQQGPSIGRISWDATAYISVPGLQNTANTIPPAFYDLEDGEVIYTSINRTNTPSTLSLNQDLLENVPFGEDTMVLVRKIGSIYLIDDRFPLSPKEKGNLDSSRTIFETQNKNLSVIGSSEIKFLPEEVQLELLVEWTNPVSTLGNFSGLNKIGYRYEVLSNTDIASATFSLVGSLLPATGDLVLKVYDDNMGVPGSVIATSSPVSFLSYTNNSPQDFKFEFSTPITLTSGVQYYFILEAEPGFINGSGLSVSITATQQDATQVPFFDLGLGWTSSVTYNIVGSIEASIELDPSVEISSSLFLQVAGLPLAANTIGAERYFILENQFLIFQINRSATPTVLVSLAITEGDEIPIDSFVFAYNDGTYLWLWNGERLEVGKTKVNGEAISKEVAASLGLSDYKDKEGQVRILATDTPSQLTLLTPVNKIAIDGTRRSFSSKNLDSIFDGVRINWQTGEILTYDGLVVLDTFTAPNTVIASGQSRWYSISLRPSTANANNEMRFDVILTPAATDSAVLKATYTSSSLHVGQVLLSNVAGVISPILQSHIIQNSAAGSGGGGGGGFNLEGPLTILDNQPTPQTLITLSLSENRFAEVTYSIERNGSFRIGKLYVSTDGSIVAFSDQNTETGLSETVLSATVVGPNLVISYTTTFTGSNGTFKYSINSWN